MGTRCDKGRLLYVIQLKVFIPSNKKLLKYSKIFFLNMVGKDSSYYFLHVLNMACFIHHIIDSTR